MTPPTPNRPWFPGLHGWRFLAAFAVMAHHMHELKGIWGYELLFKNAGIAYLGNHGVTFFFVLSGFLITWLLMQEREAGGISVKRFYVRRMLRIWPLYFLMLLIGFGLLPFVSELVWPLRENIPTDWFWMELALFGLMLPNIASIIFPPFPLIAPLWSIGVEEQFYAVWPWVVKRVKSLLPALILLAGWISVVRVGCEFGTYNFTGVPAQIAIYVGKFLGYGRFDCMVVGGIAALVLMRHKAQLQQYVFTLPVQLAAIVLAGVLLFTGATFWLFTEQLHALIYAVLILNTAANPKSLFGWLENGVFRYLGNISYGIYVWHSAMAALCHT